MMLNLFSIFDSYSLYFSNWFSSLLGIIFIPQIYWLKSSRMLFMFKKFLLMLWNEFIVILNFKFNINNMIYFISLFMFIMYNNFMGLFPYVFTSSSHLIYSMIFSLSMWMGMMFFGWFNNTKFMLMHLVPQGTPFMLMFFMVFIELLSSLIRPMTLCIRLTANMIAGHLLLTLLGMFIPNSYILYVIIFFLQFMLLMLEFSVSLIQSYVFVVLTILYLKETN